MTIKKFNIEEYRIRKGHEYSNSSEGRDFRKVLKEKNIQLVPFSKGIPKHQSAKIKSIESFAKTQNFWNVFIVWQSIPGVKKIRGASANMNAMDFTNIFKTTALVVQAFLAGKVYTKGYVDFKRPIRNVPTLPDNFKDLKIDYSCEGLINYINRFELIRNSPDHFPKDKKYFKTLGLAEFIFGGLTSYSNAKSVLLTQCINEPRLLFKDPDETATLLLKKLYNEYVKRSKYYDANETKGLSMLASRLVCFAEVNNIEISKFFEEFFKSLDGWDKFSINYLYSKHMFDRFLAHLQSKGYTLKEESIIKIKEKEKPILDTVSPRKRRKILLVEKKQKGVEGRKKINKPMKIKRS